jgi:hypothetical protein
MLDGLPAEFIGAVGPTALLGITVLFILGGRLIPRSTHDAIVASKDAEIAYLRATVATEQERGALQAEQVHELLEHSRTTVAVIQSLPRAAQRGPT